jgi:Protein of unknown function (DUF732)
MLTKIAAALIIPIAVAVPARAAPNDDLFIRELTASHIPYYLGNDSTAIALAHLVCTEMSMKYFSFGDVLGQVEQGNPAMTESDAKQFIGYSASSYCQNWQQQQPIE